MQGVGWGRLTLTSFAPPPALLLEHLSSGLRSSAKRCSMLVVSQSPPAKESTLSENPTASSHSVARAFRNVAGRGRVGCGFYVTDAAGRVVAGPYTSLLVADLRAVELERELERENRRSRELAARGLDELAARRVAAALGVELGPLTAAEVAATAELECTAGELGVELEASR